MMGLSDAAAEATRRYSCSCTSLRKASRRISQLYDAALTPSGIKTTQRAILAEIGRSEPMTVGQLADALVMDAGALAHTLKPLVRDGFVSVGIDPTDRRNRLISMTLAGRTKLAESDEHWESAQRGFEAAFGRTHSETLREAMRILVSSNFAADFAASLSSLDAERL